jgi:hypothetical protein
VCDTELGIAGEGPIGPCPSLEPFGSLDEPVCFLENRCHILRGSSLEESPSC